MVRFSFCLDFGLRFVFMFMVMGYWLVLDLGARVRDSVRVMVSI